MIQAALALGVAPEAFWRLSLKEWRMLSAPSATGMWIARRDLDEMIRAWPD
ncbi:MAG: phage tail assembly chaperone [Caulobacteraceae bacterium]|nr:phage tail assembly chaperone [Caulobacteraceae bacterium]